jgi:hypothetical protein
MRFLQTAMILYLLIEVFYVYPATERLRARSRCNSR